MDSFHIGDSLQNGFDRFFNWLPNLLGALVILLIGWIIARIVAKLIRSGLRAINLDSHVFDNTGNASPTIRRFIPSPTELLATLGFWAVMLGTISLAVSVLGVDALSRFVASVYAYLPHVLAALLIFVVAVVVSSAVAGLVARVMGDTPTGKIAATAVPILIMTIATFMILTELMIAPEIVLITYAGLIGAVALGAALAFGLGGRDAAARALETAVDKGRAQSDQVKRDVQRGVSNAKRDARDAKDAAQRKLDAQPDHDPATEPIVVVDDPSDER